MVKVVMMVPPFVFQNTGIGSHSFNSRLIEFAKSRKWYATLNNFYPEFLTSSSGYRRIGSRIFYMFKGIS